MGTLADLPPGPPGWGAEDGVSLELRTQRPDAAVPWQRARLLVPLFPSGRPGTGGGLFSPKF